jgi:hypothetical protein
VKPKAERKIIPIPINPKLWEQFGSIVDKLKAGKLASKHTSRSSIIRDLIENWVVETSGFITRQETSDLIANHGRQEFEAGGDR